jgi:hypothetical protein
MAVITTGKVNVGNKLLPIKAFCAIALTLSFTSSCSINKPETGIVNNGSVAASETESAIISSVTPVSPLIPFGTYVASVEGYTSSLTLKADGMFTYEDFFTGKRGGTYTVSLEYITYYEPITKVATRQKYSYSDKDKCLYLYISDINSADSNSESPTPFYKE